MRLAWLTDIHLDHLGPDGVQRFVRRVADVSPDAVLITGDISVARMLGEHLAQLATGWKVPIYFVLGNHDFYGGSVAAVRAACERLTAASPWLRWLPSEGVVSLTERVALVGHDAWADARAGDPEDETVRMRDWRVIEELAGLSDPDRRAACRDYGDEAADHLRELLPLALAAHDEVVVATHPPAFETACRYKGRVSPPFFLPHLTCVAAGDAIRQAAERYRDKSLLCLAGHTHGHAREVIETNVRAWTGGATYGEPEVVSVLELG